MFDFVYIVGGLLRIVVWTDGFSHALLLVVSMEIDEECTNTVKRTVKFTKKV